MAPAAVALDAFGALVLQVIGQQLSVAATRRTFERLRARSVARSPSPAEALVSPGTGVSGGRMATVREVTRRFADGRWREEEMCGLSDRQLDERLATVSGTGPGSASTTRALAPVAKPGDRRPVPGRLRGC